MCVAKANNMMRPFFHHFAPPIDLTTPATVGGFLAGSPDLCRGARSGDFSGDFARDGGQGEREATKLARERESPAS